MKQGTLAGNEARCALRYHHDRRIRVAGNQPRHDRGVGDAQAAHALDAQFYIDDRHPVAVRPHLGCAHRMEDRLRCIAKEVPQGVVVIDGLRRGQRELLDQACERRRAKDFDRLLRSAQQDFQILRVGKAAGVEERAIFRIDDRNLTEPRDRGRRKHGFTEMPCASIGGRSTQPTMNGNTWNCTSGMPAPETSTKPPHSTTFDVSSPDLNARYWAMCQIEARPLSCL